MTPLLFDYKSSDKFPIVIVLDNIRSLNNIGSVFRTTDCFRLAEIHLCGITAKPPHREIQKTALGATETVEWKYFEKTEDSIIALKELGFQVFSIEQVEKSISLEKFIPQNTVKYALIFGNEINGVSEKVITWLVENSFFLSREKYSIDIGNQALLHLYSVIIDADQKNISIGNL